MPNDQLQELPVELVLQVADHLDQQSLSRLARTSRGIHEFLNPVLYRRDLVREQPACVRWAAFHGSADALRRAIAFGAGVNVYCEGFNETASLHLNNEVPSHRQQTAGDDDD
jgi:hypothetical protein